jgi:hypothetical protein
MEYSGLQLRVYEAGSYATIAPSLYWYTSTNIDAAYCKVAFIVIGKSGSV